MARLLPPFGLGCVLGLSGLVVGFGADAWAPTAVALVLEPALLVGALWGALALHWSGRTGLAFGALGGVALAVLAARLPLPASWTLPEPAEGLGAVRRCANALTVPDAPVRLLHWRLGAAQPLEAVRGVLATARPDVAVLFGASDDSAQVAASAMGGESRSWTSPSGDVVVVAAGGFHSCGDGDEWRDAAEDTVLAFVGAPPATVFPLAVSRLPAPYRGGAAAARAGLYAQLAAAGATNTVLIADTLAPHTYRVLDQSLLDLGLVGVPTPPGWPWASVIPALHPDVRVWTGASWRLEGTLKLDAPVGEGPPVVTVLRGLERGEG